ncbi:hypothetical protein MAPG_00538 [Magnaporthiopsis poae ATCC 64411]|uniref:RING-type E3 ubiquitin transferase n=1 Tax=Magnaporthiopsis poae (strain ATCC 64411 / 73-15) TaxID=644358 RepID=A0A0C4DL98_MAGP6|nr:hypothetical protein MAPG_00538 [Magnaporthiopsis poae ATCC 64411]
MSAFFHGRHLDAFAGREVVFCHNCRHEWYHDTGDLQCPRCTSGATEIITDRENDPRDLEERDTDREPNLYDDGIERQFGRGPGGLFFSRTTYRSPSRHEPGGASGPVHPADPQAILHRFAEMVGDLDPGRPGSDGPATAPDAPFARATIRRSSFGNGQTGFTITTPPVRVERGGHGPPHDIASDFAMLFGTIMGNITPQAGNSPFGNANNANNASTADRGGVNAGNDTGLGGQQQPPHGFPLQFHQLISALFGPAGSANWGDVVTSQQELDRIISNLMEVNPQSNAAPPASQAALDKLERKKLDSTMVGSGEKVECTICIDELHQGDEVTVLPCKHWFHGECVVLWLKEHNTCPICRAPIENKPQPAASPQGQGQGQGSGSGSGWRYSTGGSMPSASLFDLRFPGRFPGNSDTAGESSASASNAPQPTTDPSAARPAGDGSSSNYRRRQVRSPSENEQRLNAIRSATFSMGMPGDSGGGNNNNNSNSRYRRNSLSPPSAASQQQQQQQQDQRRTFLQNSRTRDPGPHEPSYWSFGSASTDQERNQDGERDRTSGLFGDRSHRHSHRSSGGNGNNGEGDSSSGNSTSAPRSLANWLRGLGGSGSSSGNGNSDSRRH